MSTAGGLLLGIERAAALDYQCTQIYTTNSRTWNISSDSLDNVQE